MTLASRRTLFAIACALVWTAQAAAQTGTPAPAQATPGDDDRFLTDALGVNELELRLGRLATTRAGSPEVKDAAQKMVEKHSALRQQLSSLARKAGGSGEPRMTPEQQQTLATMESEPADRFDGAFQKTVDDGHVKELAMYEAEVSRAADPALRQLASERVTALRRAVASASKPGASTPDPAAAPVSVQGTGSRSNEW